MALEVLAAEAADGDVFTSNHRDPKPRNRMVMMAVDHRTRKRAEIGRRSAAMTFETFMNASPSWRRGRCRAGRSGGRDARGAQRHHDPQAQLPPHVELPARKGP